VPINFVTHPGISATAACFGDGIYDPVLAQRCISDLLAAEFRRIILDVYWDPGVRQYNLCPVAIPTAALSTTSLSATSAAALSTTASSFTSSRNGSLSQPPNQSTLSGTNKTLSPSEGFSSTPASTAPVTSVTSSAGEILLEFGPYTCGPALNLEWVALLLLDFFQKTSDIVEANLLFVEFNLHAAAPTVAPEEPAHTPQGNDLPQSNELIGQQFINAVADYIYEPALLQSERADLNDSWFMAPKLAHPILEFFETQTLSNGHLSTLDGWPTESYLLISKGMRLMLNWGRIDPQMEGYDFSGDSNTIFASRDVVEPRDIDANGAGDLISGCFYHEGVTDVARVNPSWARSTQAEYFPDLINNITSCGISPILNHTLGNTMANDDITSYNSFMHAAVWNWAVGEPRNHSVPAQSQFRCAILDPTSAYRGHWRVEDCQQMYPVACRVNNQPYVWEVSSDHVPYGAGPAACPTNTTFDVPRTGLENTYLTHKILSSSPLSDESNGGLNGVWLNYNSLDVVQCWVDSGPDGTCPYYEDPGAIQERSILVPTIGALIVLILTVLTLFAKCSSNRKNSRIRRRGLGLGSWEYEGVPS